MKLSGSNSDFDESGKGDDDGHISPCKPDQFNDHHRNWSGETESLTCSDSLNSSLTDDTDEETCSISPDSSRRRGYRRLSPNSRQADLPSSLTVIPDLSFDDYASREDKIHEPSSKKACHNRRKRVLWAMPPFLAGVVFYFRLMRLPHPPVEQPQDWKAFLQNDAPRIQRLIEVSPVSDTFTVRLSGGRPDLIERSVDVLTRCASVEEVQVEWQSTLRAPRKLFRHASRKVVRVEKLVTSAVLLLDEDVIFTCDELDRGKKFIRRVSCPTRRQAVANSTRSFTLFILNSIQVVASQH